MQNLQNQHMAELEVLLLCYTEQIYFNKNKSAAVQGE